MQKRLFSILICLCMVMTLLSTTALAENTQTHCICGGTHTDVGDHTSENSQTFTEWMSTDSLPTEGNKAYYLSGDVTLSDTWTVPNNTVLCLNGKTITATGDFDAITVGDGVNFTLTDCKTGTEQGKITHTEGKNGRGVYVASGGAFNMYGGIITDNSYNAGSNNSYGGGVYNGGTFHLYDGMAICSQGTQRPMVLLP